MAPADENKHTNLPAVLKPPTLSAYQTAISSIPANWSHERFLLDLGLVCLSTLVCLVFTAYARYSKILPQSWFPHTFKKKKRPRHAQTHLQDTPRNTHKQVINTKVMEKLVLKQQRREFSATHTHRYTPRRLQSRSKYFLENMSAMDGMGGEEL